MDVGCVAPLLDHPPGDAVYGLGEAVTVEVVHLIMIIPRDSFGITESQLEGDNDVG